MTAASPSMVNLDLPKALKGEPYQLAEISYPVDAEIMLAKADELSSPPPQPDWHAGRIADYVAGRLVAEYLLPQECERTIATSASGAPIWPRGWTGSISHSRIGKLGRAVAVVVPENSCRSVGVDTQYHPAGLLKPALLQRVCLPGEWGACDNVRDDKTRFALIFSAKESAYKALNGLLPASSGITLGYHSVRLERVCLETGVMEMTLNADVCTAAGLDKRHILYWRLVRGRVTTLMLI